MPTHEWIRYQVYCNIENKFVERISTDGTTPKICANVNTHDVNPDSVQIIEKLSQTSVTIKEESVPTGGFYRCETFKVVTIANSTNSVPVKFPFPITLLRGEITTTDAHRGDFVTISFPKTTIGTITSSVVVGNTEIPVSLTVIQNAKPGFDIYFTDGTSFNTYVGRVVSTNMTTGTMVLSTPLLTPYAANTIIQITRAFVDNVEFGPGASHEYNSGRSQGSSLPANTAGTFTYKNTHMVDNDLVLKIQYLF